MIVAAAATFFAATANASQPTTPNALFTQTTVTIPGTTVGTCSEENTGCVGVYGIDWLSDGRMVLLTNDWSTSHGTMPAPGANRPGTKVTLVSGLNGGTITSKDIATNFKNPTGVVVVNDRIYVADQDSFYVIPDNTGATPASNRTRKFQMPVTNTTGSNPLNFAFPAAGWTGSGTATGYYHHYMGSPIYYQGKFYASYSGSPTSGSGLASLVPSSYFDGAFLAFDTNTTLLDTNVNRAAGGYRSPNGIGMGPGGIFLTTDNQGSYLPMCTMTFVKPFTNQFLGYRQDSGYAPNWSQAAYAAGRFHYEPPVAVMAYAADGWRSLAQPLYLSSGPYTGDWLVGDVTSTGIARVAMDSVLDSTGASTVQGAALWFANSMGNDAINRLSQGPDGAIYAGTLRTIGNWPMGIAANLLYKFTPSNAAQFEIRKIRSVQDGYELYLSQKISAASVNPANIAANFIVQQRSWVRQSAYGLGAAGGEGAAIYTNRPVSSVAVSNDSLRVHLVVPGILRLNQGRRGDTITHWQTQFTFSNLTSATGGANYTTEASYAQNWISSRTWNAALATPTPASISVAQKSSLLGNHVWFTTSPGFLHVNVDIAGPYRAMLYDLQGRVLAQASGSGSALEFKAPRNAQSLYLLEVHSGSDAYNKVVMF